ncbi:MAG: PRD domain-containing protein [Streptomyces sp.]|uniref:PRD domain-containing protein n=1 Tax=Streptomyces sp. TaxID=1931 RepID=UPI003D6AF718
MEEKLALRILLFRETGQVRPEVAEFVSGELEALAATGRTVSEETAGMLTSHLVMALTRLQNGESIAASDADRHVADELADRPEVVERAREIAGRAERITGAALPDSEINFLAMHLAVLDRHSPTDAGTGTGTGTHRHLEGERP